MDELTVSAGDSKTVQVIVTPSTIDPFEGEITLTTNMPGRAEIIIEFENDQTINTIVI